MRRVLAYTAIWLMDDLVVTSHAHTICRRNFLANGDWEKLGESGMFVAEFLLWIYALMRITYSSQVRSWQLFLTQTQKLERVVPDAARRLCNEFLTHRRCSQFNFPTEYSNYRRDVTVSTASEKPRLFLSARFTDVSDSGFVNAVTRLASRAENRRATYGEADVSLAAVTETIVTVLHLVTHYMLKSTAVLAKMDPEFLGWREIWKRCKID
ncbi:hypothetical protein CABS03_01994 [Colletotrichum abscissum]